MTKWHRWVMTTVTGCSPSNYRSLQNLRKRHLYHFVQSRTHLNCFVKKSHIFYRNPPLCFLLCCLMKKLKGCSPTMHRICNKRLKYQCHCHHELKLDCRMCVKMKRNCHSLPNVVTHLYSRWFGEIHNLKQRNLCLIASFRMGSQRKMSCHTVNNSLSHTVNNSLPHCE